MITLVIIYCEVEAEKIKLQTMFFEDKIKLFCWTENNHINDSTEK